MPVQQQPMAPMPFYADPNRFSTPVWQADPSQGWQGQFIQQLPASAQPIETYQQYPNGIYQATYQQPTFETNTFYTGAVQVLTNSRPPSVPNQQVQLAPPRPNSNYSQHTPSPSPAQQQQQQSNNGRQYQEYIAQPQNNQQQQNFIPSATTPTGNENSQNSSNSRPGSVNNIVNPPTPNQNFNQQAQQQHQQQQSQSQQQQQMAGTAFTTIANFSPNSAVNYVNANSGNAQPGYPQVNSSSPQLTSHNSSGYPGQEQYGGQQWQNDGHIIWEQSQIKMEPGYDEDQQNNQYIQQEINHSPIKMEGNEVQPAKTFSQADKVNLNTRIKTMILNKQQENKVDDSNSVEQQNTTGHFLWYSHHHHLTKRLGVDGGSPINKPDFDNITNKEPMESMSRYKSLIADNYYSTNQLKFENRMKFAQDKPENQTHDNTYHNASNFLTKDSHPTKYHPQNQLTSESPTRRKIHCQSSKPQKNKQNRLSLPQFVHPHNWKLPIQEVQSAASKNHFEKLPKVPIRTEYLLPLRPSDDVQSSNVQSSQQRDQLQIGRRPPIPEQLLQHQIEYSTRETYPKLPSENSRGPNLQSPTLSDSNQIGHRPPIPQTPLEYNHQNQHLTPQQPSEFYPKTPSKNTYQQNLRLSELADSVESERVQPLFKQQLHIEYPMASSGKDNLPGLQLSRPIPIVQNRGGPPDPKPEFDHRYQFQNSQPDRNYPKTPNRNDIETSMQSPKTNQASTLEQHRQIRHSTSKALSRNEFQTNFLTSNQSNSVQSGHEPLICQQQFQQHNKIQHSNPLTSSENYSKVLSRTESQFHEHNQIQHSTPTARESYLKAPSRNEYQTDLPSPKPSDIAQSDCGPHIVQSPLEHHHQSQHSTSPTPIEREPLIYQQEENNFQIQMSPKESYPKAPSRNEYQPNMQLLKPSEKIPSGHESPMLQPRFKDYHQNQHSIPPTDRENYKKAPSRNGYQSNLLSPKPSDIVQRERGSEILQSPLEQNDQIHRLTSPNLREYYPNTPSRNGQQSNLQSPKPSDSIQGEPRSQFPESPLEQNNQIPLSTPRKPSESYFKATNRDEYQPNLPSPNASDNFQTTRGHQLLHSTPKPRELDQDTENHNSSTPFLSPQLEPKLILSTPSPSKNMPFKFKGTPVSPVLNKQQGMEIPDCKCFPPENTPPEPGTYYTHLGCANNLKSLRYDLECRTGVIGDAIRIEKVRYTGKEGKTAQGCPIAKWVIRRQNAEEKYLVIVKHRRGHFCHCAFIVICLVAWDGLENGNADELYSLLTQKLNKFGLPTKRRCATNEPRTCACQGINQETCGASFSFGCSWSMYYNGCKFTRSKEVRKFRLSEKNEEVLVEDKLQELADHLSPMYQCLAPKSFKNQILFENIASDCRLGTKQGRPFSGVTACVDFCAHAHKDLHNMTNGCTVVVSLTKHRGMTKPQDEQLHVLPLYVADDSDEYDSKENQNSKIKNGSIEVLNAYPCEVRTCSVPAETCLRRGRKAQEPGKPGRKRKNPTPQPHSPSVTSSTNSPNEISSNSEIQNEQVSSTVLGYPSKPSWRYDNLPSPGNSNSPWYSNRCGNGSYLQSPTPTLPQFSFFKTPYTPINNYNDYHQNGYLRKDNYSSNDYYNQNYYYYPPNESPTPHLSNYSAQFSNYPSYQISNPFDDFYPNNTLLPIEPNSPQTKDAKQKIVDISFTDNAECFRDSEIGGVAIALQHGSVLFECAKHELHATTALKNPDRLYPTRISLVFYQHRNLNKAQHGLDEYTEKMKRKLELSNGSDSDKSSTDTKLDISSLGTCRDDVLMRAPTLPTMSLTTMFPMYPCIVTGPFREQLP